MVASTRCLVGSLTRCERPLITLDTVMVDTPARRATSVIVTPPRRRPSTSPNPHRPTHACAGDTTHLPGAGGTPGSGRTSGAAPLVDGDVPGACGGAPSRQE